MKEDRAYLSRNPITDGYSYQHLMLEAFQVDNADLDTRFSMQNLVNLIFTEANWAQTRNMGTKEEQLKQVKSNLIEAMDRMQMRSSNVLEGNLINDVRVKLSLANNSTEVMMQVWRLKSVAS